MNANELRAAADYRRNYLRDRQPSAVAWQTQGDSILADAYLALTDPTPLSVEVLVGMGGKREGKGFYRIASLTVHTYGETDPKFWGWSTTGSPVCQLSFICPRTAGELAMLLAMMEGR